MKSTIAVGSLLLLLGGVAISSAQEKAAVQMDKSGSIHAGDPITFTVKLDEPMPKGAHFDFRISPVAADEEIALGPGEPVGGSDTVFHVAGKLPDEALPGDWHIAVVWFFLPGAGWTHRTLGTNDLHFHVEGKAYPIPTKADVTLVR
jgi:hypothetical protein